MKVQTLLTIRFGFIVASILLVFSVGVYSLGLIYRSVEFYERLERRARIVFNLNLAKLEVPKELEEIMAQRLNPALIDEQIMVFDENNNLVFSQPSQAAIRYDGALLNAVRSRHTLTKKDGYVQIVAFLQKMDNKSFVILASGYDKFGFSKLSNLRNALIISFLTSIAITMLLGGVFASQALAPLHKLMKQVAEVNAGNLSSRVEEGKQTNEFEHLAMHFNQMLARLQAAFDTQKNFVASASHELRTPLAAIRSQIQVALSKDRSAGEYRTILQSVLEDTDGFIRLTTGLLQLAQSDVENQRELFKPYRVDEILFSASDELARLYPDFHVQFSFDEAPTEDDNQLTVNCNNVLLTTAFLNLMENACKFAPDHTVKLVLRSEQQQVLVSFKDNGIGIPQDEQERIFEPFQRGSNAAAMAKGHGIGLSICQKIVQLHGGTIKLESTTGSGSTFTVILPNITSNPL